MLTPYERHELSEMLNDAKQADASPSLIAVLERLIELLPVKYDTKNWDE